MVEEENCEEEEEEFEESEDEDTEEEDWNWHLRQQNIRVMSHNFMLMNKEIKGVAKKTWCFKF